MTIPASMINSCCPEIPACVVQNTTVVIDGNTALFQDEQFDINDSNGNLGLVFNLTDYPISDENVFAVIGGAVQRLGVDFTIDGKELTLSTALAAGQTLLLKYMSVSDVTNFSARGTVVGYEGAAAPSGWLKCDGSAYSLTTYAALYAWMVSNLPSMIGTVTATTFVILDAPFTIHVGGVLRTLHSIIKT